MAVNTSVSGGIYIEIAGNLTKLYESLNKAREVGNWAAGDIAASFKHAMSAVDVSSVTNSVTKAFAQARTAAQAFKTNLSAFEQNFKNMGKEIGLSGKELERFARANADALQKKNSDDFTAALRALQKQTGYTSAEMNTFAKSLGGTGTEFRVVEKSANAFGSCLKGMAIQGAAAYVGVNSLRVILEKVTGAATDAARYETLGVAMYRVGENVGYTRSQLDGYVSAFENTGIAMNESVQNVTRLSSPLLPEFS